ELRTALTPATFSGAGGGGAFPPGWGPPPPGPGKRVPFSGGRPGPAGRGGGEEGGGGGGELGAGCRGGGPAGAAGGAGRGGGGGRREPDGAGGRADFRKIGNRGGEIPRREERRHLPRSGNAGDLIGFSEKSQHFSDLPHNRLRVEAGEGEVPGLAASET